MIIYHFNKQTGELIGASDAKLDPREGQPLVPAFATLTAPPQTGVNEVAVFNGSTWEIYPDYRGDEYWLEDRTHVIITEIGVEPPSDSLSGDPGPTIEEAKEAKLKELEEAYQESKETPFVYTIGETDYYFTRDKESIQGTQSKCLSSTDKTLPIETFRGTPNEGSWLCYNAGGSVAFVPFTKEEFITFADAFYLVNSDNFTNYVGHEGAISALTTIEDLDAYDVGVGWV